MAFLFSSLSHAADKPPPRHREDRVLAKLKAGVTSQSVEQLRSRQGVKTLRNYPRLRNVEVIETGRNRDLSETIAALKNSGLFEYVEPDYLWETFAMPNDPLFTNQWALQNTGQSGGSPDADIDAPEGWDLQNDAGEVIVAIVDTGIRLDHVDLAANLWVNPGEVPGNSLDDDGNGYVDDVHGINTIFNNGNPADDVGHGTHVAGVIGALGNNGVGISGVAWRAKIMPLKFLSPFRGSTSDAIECLDYALAKGARIVNASWGGFAYSQALYDTIDALRTNGIIFVAAAGNAAIDLDRSFTYPAAFKLDNIVTVNATTRSNTVVFFSNDGYTASDLGAPGYQIFSTYYTSNAAYQTLSGTSMAAPHVAGALALLLNRLPAEHYLGAIYRLLGTVEVTPALRNRCLSGGQLNLHRLLADAAASAPANDHFANRTSVSGARWTRFARTLGATREPSEPQHAANGGGASVWWTWTAPYTGPVELTCPRSIQTNGAPLNTLLAVYTGSAMDNLAAVASNDDGGLPDDGSGASRLAFVAVAGTTYHIAVDGRDGGTGYVRLALAYSSENDSLASSYKLNGLYIACDGWNLGATKEASEANHAGNAGGRSIWWSWRAPVSGEMVVTTEGSNFDTVLGVYTGSSHPLTLVAANNDDTGITTIDDYGGKTSATTFSAVEGEVYHIAVDGLDAQAGHIFLAGGYKMTVQGIARTLGTAEAERDRINAFNQVAGPWIHGNPSSGLATRRGYHYDYDSRTFTDLGLWQETYQTSPNDISHAGQVVGFISYDRELGFTQAFLWDRTAGMRRLDDTAAVSQALAINNGGLVGGYYRPPAAGNVACYWWSNRIYELPLPFAGDESAVKDVDESGTMIGSITTVGPTRTGLLWHNVLGDVSVVTLAHRLTPSSMPEAMNDRGEIVGQSGERAVVWREKKPQMVGHLGFDNQAWGLNNLGQIVGTVRKQKWDDLRNVPVISQNGVDLVLERLTVGWNLTIARSINDNGLIVGRGFSTDLLSCVISPPTAVMLKSPALLANGQFRVGLTGPPELTCEIEGSTDLTGATWVPLGSVTLSDGAGQFTDTDAPNYPHRFYRARIGSKLSSNAAGYLVRTVPAGFSMVSNPLQCADNRVPALFGEAPDGTIIWKWNADAQAYRDANTFFAGYGWYPDPEMTVGPGEAAIIDASMGSFTVKWAGLVPQNCPRLDVAAGLQMLGSQTPVSGQPNQNLELPFAHGDSISIMTGADGTYTTYTHLNGEWTPSTPSVNLGQGFFSQRRDPIAWTQNLSIW